MRSENARKETSRQISEVEKGILSNAILRKTSFNLAILSRCWKALNSENNEFDGKQFLTLQ